MLRFISVSVLSGLIFGALDGLIHGNPLAQRVYAAYAPIAKASLNIPVGVAIDLAYGFLMAGIFKLLYAGLPGKTGLIKGVAYGFIIWFFRVLMSVVSSWLMYTIPINALLYSLFCGWGEMLVLGVIYGCTLKPFRGSKPADAAQGIS